MRDELVEVLVKCKPKTGLAILRILCFVLCAICVLLGTAVMGGWLFFIAAVVFGLFMTLTGALAMLLTPLVFGHLSLVAQGICRDPRSTRDPPYG